MDSGSDAAHATQSLAPPPAEGEVASRRARPIAALVWPFVIVTAVVLTFLPTIHNGFLDWGDSQVLVRVREFQGIAGPDIRWMFTTSATGRYQPLTWISFAADNLCWGPDAFGFHLTSIALHAVNALLVYFAVRKLLRLAKPGVPVDGSVAAAAAALLFALHPLRVEPVAWAVQRGYVLSATAFLVALLAYLQAEDARRTSVRGEGWTGLAVVATVAAVLTKTAAGVLVLVLIVIDIYPLRRLGGQRGWWGRSVRRVWLEKIPFALCGLGALAIAALVRHYAEATGAQTPTATVRAGQFLFGLAFQLWKTFWPTQLSPVYELPIGAGDLDARFVGAGVVVLAVGAISFAWRRRWPVLLAAWACYLALCLPVLGVLPGGWPIADRCWYLSGLIVPVLVAAAIQGARRGATRRGFAPGLSAVLVLLALTAAAAFSVLSRRQCAVWEGPLTLWSHTASLAPESFWARISFGDVLLDDGNAEDAVREFQAAIRVRPDSSPAHVGLGIALRAARQEGVEAALQRAIELDPTNSRAHFELADVLAEQGRLDSAIEHLEIVRRLRPDDMVCYVRLGQLLEASGRLDAAIAVYQDAITRWPDREQPYEMASRPLLDAKRFDEAATFLQRGLERIPDSPSLANSLAWLRATCPDARHRDAEEAVRLAKLACEETFHRVASYVDTLAAAHAEAGRFDEAVRAQEAALRMAVGRESDEIVDEFRDRLELFRKRQPYRETGLFSRPTTTRAASSRPR